MSMPSRQSTCHPERRHLARGLCKPCYDKLYVKENRVQANVNAKKWRDNNPKKVSAIRRKYLYGIDEDDINARLKAQDGLCKICQLGPGTDLDHDHKTGAPRGMLCGNCNRALGLFFENTDSLTRAVRYLEIDWNDFHDKRTK